MNGVDLGSTFPEHPLMPVNPSCERRHTVTVGDKTVAWISNVQTGEQRWDSPMPSSSMHIRLSLCPDEGGPLFCGYQYLAQHHCAMSLHRDERFGELKHLRYRQLVDF